MSAKLHVLDFDLGPYAEAAKFAKAHKDAKPPYIPQYIKLKFPVMLQCHSVKKPDRASFWIYKRGAWRQKKEYFSLMERDCKKISDMIVAATKDASPMRWTKLSSLVWEDIVYTGSHAFKEFDFEIWQKRRKIPVFFPGKIATIDYDTGAIDWIDSTPEMGNLWTVDTFPVDMPTPIFDKFMSFAMADNKDFSKLLLQIAGACLTPLHLEGFYVFLRGEGKTGKTTFQKILRVVLGATNTTFLPLDMIDGRTKERLASCLANLPSESSGGKPLSIETMMRGLASGEASACDPKFRDSYDITPVAKNIFAVNKMPILTDSSDGTWRRVIIVPFDQKVERPDSFFAQRLSDELPGICHKMLIGLQELVRAGGDFDTILPACAQAVKLRYRTDCDHVLGFFAEVLDRDCEDHYAELSIPSDRHAAPQGERYALEAPRRGWHRAYCKWCSETNRKPYGEREFSDRMSSREFRERSFGVHEFPRHKTQIIRVWRADDQEVETEWAKIIPFDTEKRAAAPPAPTGFTIHPYLCDQCTRYGATGSICSIGHHPTTVMDSCPDFEQKSKQAPF